MPWPGYMQDLSQLIEDCLVPVSDDSALIDDSPHEPDAKESCPIELSSSTLAALLELDKAADHESEADKAVPAHSPPASSDSEWTEVNSISSSLHDLAAIVFNTPTLPMTSPAEDQAIVQHGDVSAVALPTPHEFYEKLLMETTTTSLISLPCTAVPAPTAQVEEQLPSNTMDTLAPATPQGPTLPTRNTDQVMADLKRVAPSGPSTFSPKRRLTTYASAKSDFTLSDLSEALVYTDKNGQSDPDDAGSNEADNSIENSDEEEILQTTKPRKITERKRQLNAAADRYMQERAEKQLKECNNLRPEEEAQQSARWLVNQSENREIISSPREYQVELFEKAKEKNIIAVLDTGTRFQSFLVYLLTEAGSGKTLIAVLLLRHIFAQELEDRAMGKPKRISFFLVDSVQLVFQQHAVLKANLDQPMNMFCGDMGCDLWSKKLWEKHFSENMVIVCTAEVLRQCLHHSFISMDQINLLIFDEAHHAKKDHAYARIIKDFYAQQEKHVVLPKIFGMTASPVDARVDVKKAAAELEAILHCQIATAADSSLLQYTVTSKQEQLAKYAALGPRFETPLYKEMYARFKSNTVLNKPLLYAYEASRELGSWCSDHIWPFVLSEEETKKLQAKTERKYHAKKVQEPLAVLEKHKEQLREARQIIQTHTFEPPYWDPQTRTSTNLSSKVVTLVMYLKERFERPTDDKCIVFVRQRYTARLLANLFSHPQIGTPYLFAGALVSPITLLFLTESC
jgi:endoribonuclease Dicer